MNEEQKKSETLKKKCNQNLKDELDKFTKYESWVEYNYWLQKMITLFQQYPSKHIDHKEELYR